MLFIELLALTFDVSFDSYYVQSDLDGEGGFGERCVVFEEKMVDL